MTLARILVTDCHTRTGFRVARDLIEAGYAVLATGLRRPTMCTSLPGLLGESAYPEPYSEADAFVACLEKLAVEHHVDAILPVKEEIFMVACHRETLEKHCRVLAPPFEKLLDLHDKLNLSRWVDGEGLKSPRSVVPDSLEGCRKALNELGLPALLKPRYGSGATGVHKLRDPGDLDAVAREIERAAASWHDYLIQPFVTGTEVGWGVVLHDGRVLGLAGQVNLRGVSSQGGLSVARTTCEDKRLEAALLTSLELPGISGLVMMDIITDKQGGYWVIDLNPRYWGGVATAMDSGVGVARLHVDAVLRGVLPERPVTASRSVENHWAAGEIRLMATRLAGGRLLAAARRFLA